MRKQNVKLKEIYLQMTEIKRKIDWKCNRKEKG